MKKYQYGNGTTFYGTTEFTGDFTLSTQGSVPLDLSERELIEMGIREGISTLKELTDFVTERMK